MYSSRPKVNTVFIIPTGVGAEIGGHAGDASPAAKLIAAVSDLVIVHPNVVNASDINEMTENMLYVEGSILDRFLEGKIELQPVVSNRILVVANSPVKHEIINSVSAARTTIGAQITIESLETPLRMIGRLSEHGATGNVFGWEELVEQVKHHDFDALAITTEIELSEQTKLNYYRNGGINPFGGVEAKASRLIATALNKPVAHAPADAVDFKEKEPELYLFNEIADPRIAPELVSISYLHCVLKGLHRAPRIGAGLSTSHISCLVSPFGCVGRPHRACLSRGIPIIVVRENSTCLNDPMPNSFIVAENYLEAAGYVAGMAAGVSPESVRRPLPQTYVGITRSPSTG